MAVTASSISSSNTLEQLRTQFNNLVSDVTGLEAGSQTFTLITSSNITVAEDGTIVLVPTIRMIDGKLKKVEDPVGEALKNEDFLTGFKDHGEAKDFSQMISTMIGMNRNENKRIK